MLRKCPNTHRQTPPVLKSSCCEIQCVYTELLQPLPLREHGVEIDGFCQTIQRKLRKGGSTHHPCFCKEVMCFYVTATVFPLLLGSSPLSNYSQVHPGTAKSFLTATPFSLQSCFRRFATPSIATKEVLKKALRYSC